MITQKDTSALQHPPSKKGGLASPPAAEPAQAVVPAGVPDTTPRFASPKEEPLFADVMAPGDKKFNVKDAFTPSKCAPHCRAAVLRAASGASSVFPDGQVFPTATKLPRVIGSLARSSCSLLAATTATYGIALLGETRRTLKSFYKVPTAASRAPLILPPLMILRRHPQRGILALLSMRIVWPESKHSFGSYFRDAQRDFVSRNGDFSPVLLSPHSGRRRARQHRRRPGALRRPRPAAELRRPPRGACAAVVVPGMPPAGPRPVSVVRWLRKERFRLFPDFFLPPTAATRRRTARTRRPAATSTALS